MKTWILLVNNSVTKAKFTDKIYQVNDEPKVKHGVSLEESVNGRVKLEPRSLRSQAKIQLMISAFHLYRVRCLAHVISHFTCNNGLVN